MTGDDGQSRVDFVAGEPDDAAQEDLPDIPSAGSATLRRNLALAAAVLVGGVLIVRGVDTKHSAPRAPALSSSPAAQPSPGASDVSRTAPLMTSAADGNRTGHTPLRLLFDSRDCPVSAVCSEVRALPDAALAALRQQFPRAVLDSTSSLLADRPGRFEPDLALRLIRAHAGRISISIDIRKATPPGVPVDSYRTPPGGATMHVTKLTDGFAVSVSISHPSRAPEPRLRALDDLAIDAALVVPQ